MGIGDWGLGNGKWNIRVLEYWNNGMGDINIFFDKKKSIRKVNDRHDH